MSAGDKRDALRTLERMRRVVARFRSEGYDVDEADDAPEPATKPAPVTLTDHAERFIGHGATAPEPRPWGREARSRTTLAELPDLEPAVTVRRDGLVIFWGKAVSERIAQHLTRDDLEAIAAELGRRVTRELWDLACELGTIAEQAREARNARLRRR